MKLDRAKGWKKPSPLFFLSPSRFPLRTQAFRCSDFSGRPPAAFRPPQNATPVPFGRPPTQQPPWIGERSPSSAVRERCRPRRPTAQTFFSPELPPPATNPGKLGLEFEFVVVRNVVEEVERKFLLKLGDHRRSPENGCRLG
ncbi:hypothetical protein ACLB2K_002420 [Fragaria x ananassa]